jgi:hypothetical protein
MSNSAYYKTDDGLRIRREEIEEIKRNFNDIIQDILDPKPEIDLSENPLFAAGQSGLDNLRWKITQGEVT